MTRDSKDLGDAGELFAKQLLETKGYEVVLLEDIRRNAPTYDLEVSRGGSNFKVSVKTSRSKQHVRMGQRRSVLRLTEGNFLFAFLPVDGHEIEFEEGKYRLWIIPAVVAKDDGLRVHDKYWDDRDGDKDKFSVMVKGYGNHHREIWGRWRSYEEAWNLLP